MENSVTLSVAGVRFTKVGKVYHFDARNVPDLQVGDQVVVETSRGWQLGTVAQVVPSIQAPEGMKIIDRKATPRDLLLRQVWQQREEDALEAGRKRSVEIGLVGIKVVSAEYSFDGTRLTVMFSSESEEKYDLKSLRQDMQRSFAPAQVEMRQIGPRDVAKMMGGMGACGKETRCCSEFLCEFSSISIRMAKEQGISLTPTEITGMCGRLRCCLIYEYDQYTQARALLPKRNKRVMTAQGEGRVLDQIPIRDAVLVQLMDDTRREFTRSEIQLLDENGVPIPGSKIESSDVSLRVDVESEEENRPQPMPKQDLSYPPEQPVRDETTQSGHTRPQGQQRGRSEARGGRPERSDRQRRPQADSQPSPQSASVPQRGPQDQPARQNNNQNRQQRSSRPPQNQAEANRAASSGVKPEENPDTSRRPTGQAAQDRSQRQHSPNYRGGQNNQGNRSNQQRRRPDRSENKQDSTLPKQDDEA
jgi:cell fate regulator YaaT (PSP1 superfamily)